MQAHRFEDAFMEHQRAMLDADVRARCNTADDKWRLSYDRDYQPYDPRRPIRVPTVALSMEVATELDFLMVAVRNVLRAQDRLPDGLKTGMTGQEVLELLRNVAEHWDEEGGRSADTLAANHPDVSLERVRFTGKETWVGGVPLSRIRAWLIRVRTGLVDALSTVGVTVHGDLASTVEGDDELVWPQDRRRYRLWTMPRLEMEEWPATEPPQDVKDAIADFEAHRFQRLRADDTDH